MKMNRIALGLTIVNIILATILLAQLRPARAQQSQQSNNTILRGRGLEIVDSSGKIRASITLQPPVEMGGKKYAQTILFRLIDSKGKPLIKIGAGNDGSSGLMAINGNDEGVVIHVQETGSSIKLNNKGKEKIITP